MSSLITLPKQIKRNEIFEVQLLISHHMETGFRRDMGNKIIPRDILTHIIVNFNEKTVFIAKLSPAIAANPYFAFPLKLDKSGTLEFIWMGDNGVKETEKRDVTVI
jgi:sulfur-oxidizing protein SoxZ